MIDNVTYIQILCIRFLPYMITYSTKIYSIQYIEYIVYSIYTVYSIQYIYYTVYSIYTVYRIIIFQSILSPTWHVDTRPPTIL